MRAEKEKGPAGNEAKEVHRGDGSSKKRGKSKAQTILFRDFETKSTLDLPDVGAWKYASDHTTDVWCCAYAVDDGPIELWVPGDPVAPEFIEAAQNPTWVVSAFNDQFERLIERHIMGPRYGWPTVPIERHRCTQAAALAHALPAKLEGVARALGLEQQKDEAGRRTMLLMAKPRPHANTKIPPVSIGSMMRSTASICTSTANKISRPSARSINVLDR
jgi:hypothetical protein